MAIHMLDAAGLQCPEPVLKIAVRSADLEEGDALDVLGDCPTFEDDVRTWCERMDKPILWVRQEKGSAVRLRIQF